MDMFLRNVEIFVFSLLLYTFLEIPPVILVGILVVAYIALLYAYPLKNNQHFHKNVFTGLIATCIALLIVQSAKSFKYVLDNISLSSIGRLLTDNWGVALLGGTIIIGFLVWKSHQIDKSAATEAQCEPELYLEHQEDLQRLHQLMENTRILGVDSTWGNGKSFVVDYFCNEVTTKEKYYIIKIEALAYKYDEFDQILINKLDELLRDNGIFSFYSTEIQPALESSKWGKFLYHFFRWPGANRTSALVGLQQELHKLPKSVLIVFEDLERVKDAEAVKRIFAIVERLGDEKIQVIYEYDRKQLDASLSLDRTFTEKYIPMEMHLTDISYETLAKYLWQELQMDTVNKDIAGKIILPVKDVKELVIRFCTLVFLPTIHLAEQRALLSQHMVITARRMKAYLLAIKIYLTQINDATVNSLEVRTVIAFFFIQNFMDKAYEKLQIKKTVEQVFTYQEDGQELTYGALCKRIQGKTYEITPENRRFEEAGKCLDEIFSKPDNTESQIIGKLFDYNLSDYGWGIFKKEPVRTAFEKTLDIEAQEGKRERINRIIWNLLQSGTSGLTDKEACAKKFIQDVLKQPSEKQHEALVRFSKELYQGGFYKDNTTVHLLGCPILENIAEALSLYNRASLQDWQQFTQLIAREWNDKVIGNHFIQTCNYIKIIDLSTYLDLLKVFNEFSIGGNLNVNQSYMHFLKKYLSYIFRYGYYQGLGLESLLHTHEIWHTTLADEKTKYFVKDTLQKSINGIEKAKLLTTPEYLRDIEIIKQFLQKNLDLIQEAEPYRQPSPVDISIEIGNTQYPHQKVINDICINFQKKTYSTELAKEIVEFMGKIYEERKLYPNEIRAIKSKLVKWKSKDSQ